MVIGFMKCNKNTISLITSISFMSINHCLSVFRIMLVKSEKNNSNCKCWERERIQARPSN